MKEKISTGAGFFEKGIRDEFGVEYKNNRVLRSLEKNLEDTYEVAPETEVICNRGFYKQAKVKKIVLPDTIKAIGESAFSGCKSLESINIPEGVREIKVTTFNECDNLKRLTLPSTISKVDKCAFCKGLVEIEFNSIPEFHKGSFFGCSGLKKIIVPKGSADHFKAARNIFTQAQVEEKD